MTPRISVVIPLFNEGDIVEELYQRLSSVLQGLDCACEIVFVDDGSRDASLDKLRAIQERDERVVVLELSRNFGQTAALAAGVDFARGEIIVTMDGDLQHAPEEIPRFLGKLEEGFDIVSGWRQVRLDNFWLRRLPSRCANALMRLVSGVSVRDFGSTFKAYRAEVLHHIELFGELHRFIPALAHRIGARIVEIPIEVRPRVRGQSKYGLRRTFGVFEDLVFLEFYMNYLTKPIRAFGKLFFFFFSAGFAISLALMLLWLAGVVAAVREHGALLLFAVFLMIVGVQFLVAGVLAELLSRVYMHSSGNRIYTIRRIHGGDVRDSGRP